MPYKDPAVRAAYSAAYHAKNRDRSNGAARAWHAAHRTEANVGRVNRNRLTRYGLNPKSYEHMMWRQGGLCAICTDTLSPGVDVAAHATLPSVTYTTARCSPLALPFIWT
jgi:hypothetical protein